MDSDETCDEPKDKSQWNERQKYRLAAFAEHPVLLLRVGNQQGPIIPCQGGNYDDSSLPHHPLMTTLDLAALQPLLQRLEIRAGQWETGRVQDETGQRFMAELQALRRCTGRACVHHHLDGLLALTHDLPEADITLLHALREAADTWL